MSDDPLIMLGAISDDPLPAPAADAKAENHPNHLNNMTNPSKTAGLRITPAQPPPEDADAAEAISPEHLRAYADGIARELPTAASKMRRAAARLAALGENRDYWRQIAREDKAALQAAEAERYAAVKALHTFRYSTPIIQVRAVLAAARLAAIGEENAKLSRSVAFWNAQLNERNADMDKLDDDFNAAIAELAAARAERDIAVRERNDALAALHAAERRAETAEAERDELRGQRAWKARADAAERERNSDRVNGDGWRKRAEAAERRAEEMQSALYRIAKRQWTPDDLKGASDWGMTYYEYVATAALAAKEQK